MRTIFDHLLIRRNPETMAEIVRIQSLSVVPGLTEPKQPWARRRALRLPEVQAEQKIEASMTAGV